MAFNKEYWAQKHARVLSTICATLSPFTRRSSIINFTHFCAAGLFFGVGAAFVVLLEDVDFAFALALPIGSIPFSGPAGCGPSHSIQLLVPPIALSLYYIRQIRIGVADQYTRRCKRTKFGLVRECDAIWEVVRVAPRSFNTRDERAPCCVALHE